MCAILYLLIRLIQMLFTIFIKNTLMHEKMVRFKSIRLLSMTQALINFYFYLYVYSQMTLVFRRGQVLNKYLI